MHDLLALYDIIRKLASNFDRITLTSENYCVTMTYNSRLRNEGGLVDKNNLV
jgi:hypothetical protein